MLIHGFCLACRIRVMFYVTHTKDLDNGMTMHSGMCDCGKPVAVLSK